MSILRLQHIGMAAVDYEKTCRAFERAGLPTRDFRNDQGKGFQHDSRVLLGNECWLHVVHNWNPESRVNRFMRRHGQKLEHVALETDGIEADVKRLRELGVPIYEDEIFDANDGYEAFVYPDDAIGFTVELIQPHAHSWGYPNDAHGRPVSDVLGVTRLVSVRARVRDVGEASRRFERLFGVAAGLEGCLALGNATLVLESREEPGLEGLVLASERPEEDRARLRDLDFGFAIEVVPEPHGG